MLHLFACSVHYHGAGEIYRWKPSHVCQLYLPPASSLRVKFHSYNINAAVFVRRCHIYALIHTPLASCTAPFIGNCLVYIADCHSPPGSSCWVRFLSYYIDYILPYLQRNCHIITKSHYHSDLWQKPSLCNIIHLSVYGVRIQHQASSKAPI